MRDFFLTFLIDSTILAVLVLIIRIIGSFYYTHKFRKFVNYISYPISVAVFAWALFILHSHYSGDFNGTLYAHTMWKNFVVAIMILPIFFLAFHYRRKANSDELQVWNRDVHGFLTYAKASNVTNAFYGGLLFMIGVFAWLVNLFAAYVVANP